ncbi:unnamed protein product [Adineta steineri]|uniref:Uncharacterized protein n=1 Tax=Adineta steineri TaxID=433720 RepID=A0A815EIN9_9BILA|nr:unnamed protein product [Adineta steineri]
MATIDEHICYHTATGINAGFDYADGQAATGQTIPLGGTTPCTFLTRKLLYYSNFSLLDNGNFQPAFNNQTGVGVPPIDNERRGVPPTNEDGLRALTTNQGKL